MVSSILRSSNLADVDSVSESLQIIGPVKQKQCA